MQWHEVTVSVSHADLETVQSIAIWLCVGGIYTEDYSDLEQQCEEITGMRLIDEELLAKDRERCLVHIYLEPQTNVTEWKDDFLQRTASEGLVCEVTSKTVAEEDWSENWKQYYKPTRVGSHFVVVPMWEQYEKKPDDIILALDPGMAFGTGTHESTRLCLTMLEEYIKPGCKMMDIGTGSGILAIGGLLLGAEGVAAYDIDPVAVKMSMLNAELNGVANRLTVKCGGLDDSFGAGFHCITANIVADVIIAIMPEVKKKLATDGTFIVSGIIDIRTSDVKEAAERYGFSIEKEMAENNWVSYSMRVK